MKRLEQKNKQQMEMKSIKSFTDLLIKDLIHLRKRDITNGTLRYRRSKTDRLLTVKVEPCAQGTFALSSGGTYTVNGTT